MNVVDCRYIIKCPHLMTLTKPWKKGFNLSRTVPYYQFLPVNMRHEDGKRHVYTVLPVKPCFPQNDLQKKHHDNHYAMASAKFARELANLFGAIMCFSFPKMIKLVYLWVYQFPSTKLPF